MSDQDEKTTIEVDGLDRLAKAMKKIPQINIGVLGGGQRTPAPGEKSSLSNAQIGAMHEFGTSKLPQRSFLRVPLISHLNKRISDSGILSKESIRETMRTASFRPIVQKIAIIAEGIVADAFDTGGFGEWKPSDMSRKTNQQTLVETQQLRNSITSEVVDDEEPG